MMEGSDSVEQFVGDLRVLWEETGRVPFTALARRVEPGKSSLNDAVTRTDRLPTEFVVRELVGALDPAKVPGWLTRRSRLQATLEADRATPRNITPSETSGTARSSTPARGRGRWSATVLAVAGLSAAGTLGFAAGRWTAPDPTKASQAEPETSASPAQRLVDGADPIQAGCVPDANAVAAETVSGVGTLKLIYSTYCNAFWAKLDRLDGRADGNKLEVEVFQRSDPTRAQRAVDPGVSGSYTFLLVRTDPSEPYCAAGTVWLGRKPRDIPGPVC